MLRTEQQHIRGFLINYEYPSCALGGMEHKNFQQYKQVTPEPTTATATTGTHVQHM